MVVKLNRIRAGSAFRIGAIFSALSFMVFGLPNLLLNAVLLSGSFAVSSQSGSTGNFDPNLLTGIGLVGILIFWGIGIVVAGIFGGIGAAIGAFVYNLASNWVGGLEIDLERIASTEKVKREDEL